MRITLVKLQDKLKEDLKNINQVHKNMKYKRTESFKKVNEYV